MTKGDEVVVYLYGKPDRRAGGRVQMISANSRSILVTFDDKPPFPIVPHGVLFHPELGIVMAAYREADGPWTELFNGAMFVIEEKPA